MNIDSLHEYIEFSKSLNISTAAKSLFISQSALSKHLKNIEENVGVPLIDRSSPLDLGLTEAGKVFLDACSVIVHTYDTALEKCHQLARSPKRLSILRPCTTDASMELIFEIFHNMQYDHEEISVELQQMGGYSMVENLLMGRVDCATSHANSQSQIEELKSQGIELFPLFQDHVYVWAPSDSPLLKKKHLFLVDLLEVPIFVPASRIYEDMHNWITALCSKAGFKPLLVYKDATDMSELMTSNIKDGVLLLTSEANVNNPVFNLQPQMALRQFEDEGLTNTVFLAYLNSNDNPALKLLIDCVKSHNYSVLEINEVTDVIQRNQSDSTANST